MYQLLYYLTCCFLLLSGAYLQISFTSEGVSILKIHIDQNVWNDQQKKYSKLQKSPLISRLPW